jgi:hypothetical protein
MPNHETRAFDLLLPQPPQGGGEKVLRDRIEALCAESPRDGYRRITRQLHAEGMIVNHKAVARLMRQHGLQVRPLCKFVRTTDSDHDGPIFPNLAPGFRSNLPPDDCPNHGVHSRSRLTWVSVQVPIASGIVSEDSVTFSGQSQFPLRGSKEVTFHGTLSGVSLSGTTDMTSRGLFGTVTNTGPLSLTKQ